MWCKLSVFQILVSILFAVVKSDIGIGYQYRAPASSYDVPFGSVGSLNADRKYYHVEKHNFPTGTLVPSSRPISLDENQNYQYNNFVSTTPSTLIQTSISKDSPFGGHGNIEVGNFVSSTPSTIGAYVNRQDVNSFVSTTPASILQTPIHEASPFANVEYTQQQKVSSFDTRVNSASLQSNQVGQDFHSQQPEIQRHLYFYSAPEEPEEIRPRVLAPQVAPKKNVKILFIKTPTFKYAPVEIPSQVQDEEKTLVYVFVKKPDEPQQIVLPTPESSKPSKPEVFFIKYKTQKEAEEAISSIQTTGKIDDGGSVQVISNVETNPQLNLIDKTYVRSGTGDGSGIIQTQEIARPNVGGDVNLITNYPSSSSGLPSTAGFSSHLNVNGQYHYGGLQRGSAELRTTPAPDTHSDQYSTIKTLVGGHDQEQGYSSTPAVNAVKFPTSPFALKERIQPHSEYGSPKRE